MTYKNSSPEHKKFKEKSEKNLSGNIVKYIYYLWFHIARENALSCFYLNKFFMNNMAALQLRIFMYTIEFNRRKKYLLLEGEIIEGNFFCIIIR